MLRVHLSSGRGSEICSGPVALLLCSPNINFNHKYLFFTGISICNTKTRAISGMYGFTSCLLHQVYALSKSLLCYSHRNVKRLIGADGL